jgi:hypothetical protein
MIKFLSSLWVLRALPAVLLVVSVGIWNWEREQRALSEQKAAMHLERLFRAEEEIQSLTKKLALERDASKRYEERLAVLEAERKSLLDQLAQRDEHIRRLLGEMIRVLSGSGLDAAPSIPHAKGSWDADHQEGGKDFAVAVDAMSRRAGLSVPVMGLTAAPSMGLAQNEIEKTVISGEEAAGASNEQRWVEGEILSVNLPKKFVVIGRGAEDGLQNGMGIWIYEGGRRLGRLEIESTFKKIASATFVEGDAERLRSGSSYSIRILPHP